METSEARKRKAEAAARTQAYYDSLDGALPSCSDKPCDECGPPEPEDTCSGCGGMVEYAPFDWCDDRRQHTEPEPCHCGKPVAYGYDGNPQHHRGMCEDCDTVRCDAYPGACKARDHDPVARPEHYTHSRIEVWDAIEEWGLGYRLGNVIKYVARADRKGNPIQDLRKALAYLTRELDVREQDARDL